MTTCEVCGHPHGPPVSGTCYRLGYEREKANADRRGKLLERAAECLDSGRDWTATTEAIDAELGPAAQKGSEHG